MSDRGVQYRQANIGILDYDRCRILLQDRRRNVEMCLPLKCVAPADRFVQHRTERKDIAPRILALNLLRRHVLK